MVVALLLIGGIGTLYLDPTLSPFDPAMFFAIILLIAIVGELISEGTFSKIALKVSTVLANLTTLAIVEMEVVSVV